MLYPFDYQRDINVNLWLIISLVGFKYKFRGMEVSVSWDVYISFVGRRSAVSRFYY